jgi:carbonic anhydrase
MRSIGDLGNLDQQLRTCIRGRDDNMRRSVGGERFNNRNAMGQSLFSESLESRVVLNATSTHLNPAAAIVGTISGVVTNDVTGAGVSNDKVVLYNSSGSTVAIAYTSAKGQYQFGITRTGTYVVRQFTPKGYVQTSPTFTNVAPAAGYPFQSPINITAKPINLANVLKVGYAPNNSTGATIAVGPGTLGDGVEVGFDPSNSDYLTAGGTVYQLTQFHFHSPSEDLIDGKSTNLEIHFVNQSAQGGVSVLGVFLKLGAHNYALDPILKAMNPALPATSPPLPINGPINLAGLLPTNMQGWFYQGSLTTGAFAGPLNWFVFQKPITLDLNQFKTYETFAKAEGFYPNARATQPLNGRMLNMFNHQVYFNGVSQTAENFSIAPKD